MKILRMEKGQLAGWLDELASRSDLMVPVQAGERSHRFEPYEGFDEVDLSYLRTVISPKKYLVPSDEVLWEKSATGNYTVPEIPDRDVILFGLHPCDIHGVRVLDIFFSHFERPDFYYWRRRNRTRIIGMSCLPDDCCFCHSMRTDSVTTGFDLFLHNLPDRILVMVASVEGDMMLADRSDSLPAADTRDMKALVAFQERRRKSFKLELDVSILPEAMELHRDDALWEQLGNQCLACGCCSMECPTCTCFNVYDRNDLDGGVCRHRGWDSCLYRDFALVAGGKNFRPERSQRVRNRYYHKQVGFAEQFGLPSCVGCGRCIRMCPSGIHYVEIFRNLQGGA